MFWGILTAATTVASQVAQRQQQEAAMRSQQQQAELQSQMMWRQADQQARQQRDLLKRQLAANRAALAGGGMGFDGGSGAALMAGMARQTEQDLGDRQETLALQHQARFGTGEGAGNALAQGLQAIRQGQEIYGVMRPLFSSGAKA
ncbi:MAG: hypothetical protein HQL42_11315 [Alphaproteobacteria bacterium]|nr:hypothetical protein [Alphaproteobacteria bacterium]